MLNIDNLHAIFLNVDELNVIYNSLHVDHHGSCLTLRFKTFSGFLFCCTTTAGFWCSDTHTDIHSFIHSFNCFSAGVPYKTFGYININISDANLKRCKEIE